MFSFAGGRFIIPDNVRQMCADTWDGIARPGTSWTAVERLAIAERARAERLGMVSPADDLEPAAADTICTLAARPATTSQAWVDTIVAAIGDQAYLEIVGIVARVTAIDTFTRLVGVEPQPFPAPHEGAATPEAPSPQARKGKAWVKMIGFPVPPSVLSLVPAEQAATNATAEALYMTGREMENPDIVIDGLHRTQIETVATTVSHRNECFY